MNREGNPGLHDQLIFELLKAIDRFNEIIDSRQSTPNLGHSNEPGQGQVNCNAVLREIKELEDVYGQLLDTINNIWDELSTLNNRLAIIERSMKTIYNELSLLPL